MPSSPRTTTAENIWPVRGASANGAGVWIIDAAGVTTFGSERMAEILGATTAEMLGQPSFNFVFPHDVEKAAKLFEVKKSGGILPFRFDLRRRDGTAVRVEVHGTPLHDKKGAFEGIVGIFIPLDPEQ